MKLTLVVPTYQLGAYLRPMLATLTQQTAPFELWLVDDGSTDGTAAQAAAFAAQRPEAHFYALRQHQGVSAARNYGLAHATGDAIAFVDGDDRLAPTFVETLVHGFALGVTAVSVGYRWFRTTPVRALAWQTVDQATMFGQVAHHGTQIGGYVWNKAFARSAIGALRFDESLPLAEDYWFTANFVANSVGPYAYWPASLYDKRSRPNSTIHTASFEARQTEARVFERIRALQP
ncbi:glycosyltransferase family 2 protein [Lacticaseibacillus absianus]|uniref:glycosyltransferase family 2 protein n=1 Tax=Lacticaseibacillus absianus TaxID=2729623 RepID=UPI0015CD6BF1|nr:glycosyltransferase family 2 protein [Lacticaseibacillus absianus]